MAGLPGISASVPAWAGAANMARNLIALINGDESGFGYSDDPADREAYDGFVAWLAEKGFRVVDVVRDRETGEAIEARFTWSGHLHFSAHAGVDVVDYELIRPATAEEIAEATAARAADGKATNA